MVYPIIYLIYRFIDIYRGSTIQGDAGFLPSTVCMLMYECWMIFVALANHQAPRATCQDALPPFGPI